MFKTPTNACNLQFRLILSKFEWLAKYGPSRGCDAPGTSDTTHGPSSIIPHQYGVLFNVLQWHLPLKMHNICRILTVFGVLAVFKWLASSHKSRILRVFVLKCGRDGHIYVSDEFEVNQRHLCVCTVTRARAICISPDSSSCEYTI